MLAFILGVLAGAAVVVAVIKTRTGCTWREAAVVALGGGGPGPEEGGGDDGP